MKLKIRIVKTIPKISGDVHAVPDALEDFTPEEAYGTGHQAGLDDLETFRAKITKLYEEWQPPEDNQIAMQYKQDLAKLLKK